jgi:hypothetical protein
VAPVSAVATDLTLDSWQLRSAVIPLPITSAVTPYKELDLFLVFDEVLESNAAKIFLCSNQRSKRKERFQSAAQASSPWHLHPAKTQHRRCLTMGQYVSRQRKHQLVAS